MQAFSTKLAKLIKNETVFPLLYTNSYLCVKQYPFLKQKAAFLAKLISVSLPLAHKKENADTERQKFREHICKPYPVQSEKQR